MICVYNCLIKNLAKKTQLDKILVKEKSTTMSPLSRTCLIEKFQYKSLSRCIPIFFTNFLNVMVGSAFVNKSARLSLEQTWWTSMSYFFWNSWVKKNFDKMCLVPLIYPPLTWAIQVVLSSYITFRHSLMEDKPHVSFICWINDLN